MEYKVVALSPDLVSLQASLAVQGQTYDGHYANVSLGFEIAEGHYGKRQMLEKAKRLLDEVSRFLEGEIARSP
jgi:hypothetical protein